jgi:hypothetical protein
MESGRVRLEAGASGSLDSDTSASPDLCVLHLAATPCRMYVGGYSGYIGVRFTGRGTCGCCKDASRIGSEMLGRRHTLIALAVAAALIVPVATAWACSPQARSAP